MAEPARAKPKPTPETQHFWDGTQAGELRLQRCDACANVYFPPRPFCPSCASRKVSIFKASGKGTLYSYVINHRPAAPGFTPPYAIAVVQLELRHGGNDAEFGGLGGADHGNLVSAHVPTPSPGGTGQG